MTQVAATAAEQFFLELMNRARLNPTAEATFHGITLNQGIAAGTLNASQRQVLAINPYINAAADVHSEWMRLNNTFSHTGLNAQGVATNARDRMTAEGYSFTGSWSWGENVAWIGGSAPLNVIDAVIAMHHNLFISTLGHRQNLLNNTFREAGVGLSSVGPFTQGGVTYANSITATQNFALSGTNIYVTGVTYTDTDVNNFYSVGEGIGSRTVQLFQNGVAALSTVSTAAGGFAIATSGTGVIEARFSGGGLTSEMGASFSMGGENVKIDLVNNSTILSSHTATLTGAALNLTLLGINANSATGNALNNILTGNEASNILDGLDGNDTLNGGLGADTLNGGSGNDTLNGGTGADNLNGGVGVDTASYIGGAAVTVDLGATTTYGYSSEGDVLIEIENLIGSSNADVLLGDALNNRIEGGLGADTINGKAGIDTLSYESKTTSIIVDLGATATYGYSSEGDTLVLIENLVGSALSDILVGDGLANRIEGGLGGDTINGKGGVDTASYENKTSGITADLGATPTYGYTSEGDILVSIENLVGSSHDDTLLGDGLNNLFEGGAGNDYINGRGGSADTVTYANSATAVTLDLAATPTYGYAFDGTSGDTLIGIENVIGSSLGDILLGDSAANSLEGGLGNDYVKGGLGSDTFVFSAALFGTDTIADFQDGIDHISLQGSGLSFASFTINQSGADTILSLIANPTQTITLLNVASANITGDDFL